VPSISLPATGSWPISTRRDSHDGRLWFVDCGGSHRAVPQSRAHGRPKRGGSISAGRRTDSSSVGKRTLKTGTRSYRIDFLRLRKLLYCDWPCRLPRRGFAFPGQANAWRLSVNRRRTAESSRDLFRDSSPPNLVFCPVLFGFRAEGRKTANCENRSFTGVFLAQTTGSRVTPLSSGSPFAVSAVAGFSLFAVTLTCPSYCARPFAHPAMRFAAFERWAA
jgi:hypothetical protein